VREENAAQLYDILPCERINGQQLPVCVGGQIRRQRARERNATRDPLTQPVQSNHGAPGDKHLTVARLLWHQLPEPIQQLHPQDPGPRPTCKLEDADPLFQLN